MGVEVPFDLLGVVYHKVSIVFKVNGCFRVGLLMYVGWLYAYQLPNGINLIVLLSSDQYSRT